MLSKFKPYNYYLTYDRLECDIGLLFLTFANFRLKIDLKNLLLINSFYFPTTSLLGTTLI